MKKMTDVLNESLLLQKPMVIDNEVKVLALTTSGYIDDNIDLIKGMNRVCLVWSTEDKNGYMCANGGVSYGDGKHWSFLKDIDRIIGKQDWKKIESINVDYSYRGQIGDKGGYDIDVYSASIPLKDMMKMYKQNGISLWIKQHRGYATSKLQSIFKGWKSKGLI